MDNINYEKITKWLIFLLALAYVVPVILLGHNSYIRLHDTLEGEWEWLKLLADNHMALNFYQHNIVPQVMNGLPRYMYPSGLSVNVFLLSTFGPYYGYLLSSLLIRIIGFTGMSLLLRSYFIELPENRFIVWCCALMFCVLPVFIPFGLTVMGQPLLLWAFFNLQNHKKLIASYLIIAAFPFYSSVVWLAVPFGVLLIASAGYFLYNHKKISAHYLWGIALLVASFALVNYPMVSSAFINTGFSTNRDAYNLYMFDKPSISKSLLDALIMLVTTHYHVASLVPMAALLAILIVLKTSNRLLMTILLSIFGIILFQSFYSFPEYWLDGSIGLMKSFRFNRFSILLPFLWLLGFAIALVIMRKSPSFKPMVIPFIAVQLFFAFGGNDEVLHNYRTLLGRQKFPGYDNYTAPNQFKQIQEYHIGKPQSTYNVASFGMSPSIAQCNGFYTLDGLMAIYDLKHKEAFRKVFAGEIDKSKEIAQYYDGWGNRCYIFSSELGISHTAYSNYKFQHHYVEHLDFNAKAFAALGGKYLISAVEIKNHDAVGLHLERIFSDTQSWWTIYLYSLNENV